MTRDYKKEYTNYQGKPAQLKKRASRNSARATLAKGGAVKKGDGQDVHHKDGNPKNNKKSNLAVTTKAKNRSFPRTATAGKKKQT
tara:strand:- start:47910 stop:48164 length:255 start_codon:yes stop_codon:yes gene_type:complete